MSLNASHSEASRPPNLQRRLWQGAFLWGLFLIVLIFIAYARVFNAGFIWDDESHLTQNPCIIGPLGLKEIWTSPRAVYYPLVLTTFWALHKFAGLSPWPYHVLNVVLHAGSALLLWQILRRLNVRGAWLGAALWALHPVMVQSVAWVTELKNTQSAFLYLLSIFCFLKWGEQPRIMRIPETGDPAIQEQRAVLMASAPQGKSGARPFLFVMSLVFFVLATLSKPSVVMLPGVLALCIWWRRGRIRWHDVAALTPFVLVSALASVWTILEQKFHAGAIGAEWAQTWPDRFIIAGRAIWFYVAKLAWPHPLIFIYPRWKIESAQFIAYLPLVAALAGLLALWLNRARWSRGVFFAAAYYVVSLFPVLGFFSVYFFRYSFVSDHFQYLASMGPLALAGAGVVTGCTRLTGWKRLSESRTRSPHPSPELSGVAGSVMTTRALAGACGVLLLLLVMLTWQQTAVYHNLVTLYTVTLTKNPGCWMAHYNLGIALNEQGDTDEAIAHYRQALELQPSYAEAHYNLGRLLVQKGQLDEAITHYEKALEVNPSDAEAQNNLGVTLAGSGRVDEAIAHYQEALKIRPNYAEASCNLANALVLKGDLDGAIARYSVCLVQMPDQAEAQYNFASALLRQGGTDEAIEHFRKTLQLFPQNADAHANLGIALLKKGRERDAIAQYQTALRISPENAAAQSNLAWLLATAADPALRNGAEAVALAERGDSASSRGENRAIGLRILAAAYAEAGRFKEAKETVSLALQSAQEQGNTVLINTLRDELALYELGLPYHK